MHEGIIIKSLFDIAQKSRLEENLNEVETVKVVVGKFHQVVKDVLLMYFDLMKKDIEGFENADLQIEERDLQIRCKQCHEVVVLKQSVFSCPVCKSTNTEVIHGNELYIESLKGTD